MAPRQPQGGTNGLTHIAVFAIEGIGTRAEFEARSNFIEPVQRFTQTVERLRRFLGAKRRLEVSARLDPVPTYDSAVMPAATGSLVIFTFTDFIIGSHRVGLPTNSTVALRPGSHTQTRASLAHKAGSVISSFNFSYHRKGDPFHEGL